MPFCPHNVNMRLKSAVNECTELPDLINTYNKGKNNMLKCCV